MQTTYNYEGRDDIKVKICIQSRSHLRTFFHTRVQLGVKRCRDGLCIHNKQVPFLHLFHTRSQNRQVCRPTTRAKGLSTVQRWVKYISALHALHQSCHISDSGYRCTVTLSYIHIILAGTPGFKDIHINCHLTTLHPHTMVLGNYMSVYIYMYVACSLPAK